MKKSLFFIFLALISQMMAAQTIAFWDFNSNPSDGSTTTGTTTVTSGTGTVALIGGPTGAFNTGATNDPNTTDNSGWQTTPYPAQSTANKTAGMQINVSTVGLSGINLSFYHRVSNTGAKHWTLQYTLDRTAGSPTWVDAQLFTNAVAQAWELRSYDFTAITGLNNNANVAFRFVATFDPANGTSYTAANAPTQSYGTGSTNRFDLITVSATPPTVPHTIGFVKSDTTVVEGNKTINVKVRVTTAGNVAGTIDLAASTYSTATATSDYTFPTTLTIPANATLNQEFNFAITLSDDVVAEGDEYVICKLANATNITIGSSPFARHTLYITDNDYVTSSPSNQLTLNLLSSFSNGTAFSGATQINSAEISAYDATSKRLFIANSIGSKLEIVNMANPSAPTLISSIDITPYGAINSVAAKNGIVALAIENATNKQANGKAVFVDINGVLIDSVTVGAMPDMITFNHAGTKVYTANEGEPNDAYTVDPEGSISVVDITTLLTTGITTAANVTNITFAAYIGQEATLRSQGIRIYGTGANAAQDFEPEYITVSEDDAKAWVTLQENNAVVELNLTNNTITQLLPLGYKNHNLLGKGLDASDQTFGVNLSNFPIKGMYQPDAIASYNVGGTTYFITANEGDARAYTGMNEETRVGSLTLDPTIFPNSAELKDNRVLGRLRTTNKLGDTDNDGDFDEIYTYGARSFSIWNTTSNTMIYDSGDEMERITANDATYAAFFNQNSGDVRKSRSDDKGPEPEGVAVAKVGNKSYAFVAMERTGGVLTYDVTSPASPTYVTYANNRPTDVSPEGTMFIPASQSPNGKNLLVLSNEISSTVTIYEVVPCAAPASIATIASAGGNTSICPSGSLKLFSVNPNNNHTYQWYKNDTLITGATDSTYFASQAGAYKLDVFNANGCVAISSAITLIINDAINPTITAPSAITIVANNGCGAIVNLGTPITADNCAIASVTNNAPTTFPIGTTTVTWTVIDASNNTATATQNVTVTDQTNPSIYLAQDNLVNGTQGASSSATPYLLPTTSGVKFTSLLTVGDNIGGYQMAGIPDGLGAFDNGDGTFTLLMNHEIGNTLGVARAHGSKGAFVSKWVLNKNNLSVVSGADLMQQVYLWNTGTNSYDLAGANGAAFSRFCSADLPAVSAFYNPATGLGTTERIFMNGEENGGVGKALAHIVTGANAGKTYELPRLGKAGWENNVANPTPSNTTIVAEMDDNSTQGQVYFYIGTKTNTGTEIEKAGLTNGNLYAVAVSGLATELATAPPTAGTAFSLVNLGDVSALSGTTLNTNTVAAGATSFLRPEDGAWDPSNPADFYFNTTHQLDQVNDGVGSQVGRSRLYRLRFTDISNPTLGGTITAVLDGTEGQNMMDNLSIGKTGKAILLEDVGNAAHNGKIWQYDIATDQLTMIAKHDPARFGDIGVAATAPFNQDEESSGVIDVSDILGAGMHLLVQQAHYTTGVAANLVEGGQLLAMFVPSAIGVVASAPDTVTVCANNITNATGVVLGSPATADNCSVSSVINNAPASYNVGITPVTWTVTDAAGNTNTATQYVKVNAPSAVTLSQTGGITSGTGVNTITQACMGQSIKLKATTSGSTITNYQWQKNGVDIAGQTNDSLTLTSGWGVYRVRVTNINTCITTADTFSISFRALPNANVGADKAVCAGSSITLTTPNNSTYAYSWNTGATTNSINVSPSAAASYYVTVSQAVANSGGLVCSKSDTVNINVNMPLLAPTIAVASPSNLSGVANPSVCEGATITLAASNTTGASALQWLKNGVNLTTTTNLTATTTINNTNNAAVVYTARVKDANGCFSQPSNAISATVKAAPVPSITPAGTNGVVLLCFGNNNTSASQVLTASVPSGNGTPSYQWYQSGLTGFVSVLSSYNVTISNTTPSKTLYVKAIYANGCSRNSNSVIVRKNTACREEAEVAETELLGVSVYPNPASDNVQIAINSVENEQGIITLINNLGQVVYQQKVELNEGYQTHSLNLRGLATGVYQLSVSSSTQYQTHKLIIE